MMRHMNFLGYVMRKGDLEIFVTDWKGRREEKHRKEKGALDVKFELMAGGSGLKEQLSAGNCRRK